MSGVSRVDRASGPRPLPQRLAALPVTLAPGRSLLRYYAISCLTTGPAYPFVFAYFFFRWRTLRYELDDEGITMRWGVLFRREISLSYARIQDIHLSSNLVERWLGLGKIQVQTASGSSGAEMKIEGIEEVDAMRDFLYSRMRGAGAVTAPEPADLGDDGRGPAAAVAGRSPHPVGPAPEARGAADIEALTATLREVAREVRALRETLTEAGRPGGGRPGGAEGAGGQ